MMVILDKVNLSRVDTSALVKGMLLGNFVLNSLEGNDDPRWPSAKKNIEKQMADIQQELDERKSKAQIIGMKTLELKGRRGVDVK